MKLENLIALGCGILAVGDSILFSQTGDESYKKYFQADLAAFSIFAIYSLARNKLEEYRI